jgi:hypothetical protein
MLVQDERIIPMLEYQARKKRNENKRKKSQERKSSCSLRIIPSWLHHFFGEAFLSDTAIRHTHARPHHWGTEPAASNASMPNVSSLSLLRHPRVDDERPTIRDTQDIHYFFAFSLFAYPHYG